MQSAYLPEMENAFARALLIFGRLHADTYVLSESASVRVGVRGYNREGSQIKSYERSPLEFPAPNYEERRGAIN